MVKTSDQLRPPPAGWCEAGRKRAAGAPPDRLVDRAPAETLSAICVDDYFRERAARGGLARALLLLEGADDAPPREGDEIEVAG